ncbi:hypothetical protein ASPFODRAFT_59822 [Aspergillus luchuensis CBS 106.47]|uniref:Ketoreductase (KR) domain-containing protein n=1 Tax=Aspergillus luchuensis (strain CBS 106.47) TaxID=1137211 RepID=A0A1M3TKV2_ASPLC|nr:hypothetical protein ASPFODRAFT_59822 [Aspergillus luchuensis CBS 106.47]
MKPLILITGANRGLGYATAKQLASTGKYRHLIGARTQKTVEEAIEKLDSASNDLTPMILDLNIDESIKPAAAFIQERFGPLDVFCLETNVFGVTVVTDAFILLLRASKYPDRRIVNVTSGLGQIGIAYSPTSDKTALNMINAVDAVRLQKENILSIVVCPGYCRKDFGGRRGAKSAE